MNLISVEMELSTLTFNLPGQRPRVLGEREWRLHPAPCLLFYMRSFQIYFIPCVAKYSLTDLGRSSFRLNCLWRPNDFQGLAKICWSFHSRLQPNSLLPSYWNKKWVRAYRIQSTMARQSTEAKITVEGMLYGIVQSGTSTIGLILVCRYCRMCHFVRENVASLAS